MNILQQVLPPRRQRTACRSSLFSIFSRITPRSQRRVDCPLGLKRYTLSVTGLLEASLFSRIVVIIDAA